MKNISVIGAGVAGSALISNLKEKGLNPVVGLREPSKFDGAISIDKALENAEIVIVALPFDAGYMFVDKFRNELKGKIVVDMMNPLTEDFSGYRTFDGKSGSEFLQEHLPESFVVKAFNHVIAPSIAKPEGSIQFIIGDDKDAVEVVRKLAETLGFKAEAIVDHTKAREIEALAFFWITYTIMIKDNPFIKLKIEG